MGGNLEPTDKDLVEGIRKSNVTAFTTFQARYRPMIHGIFNKIFGRSRHKLSYDYFQNLEDMEGEIWVLLAAQLNKDLEFDADGSIGALVREMTEKRFIDKFRTFRNHRSWDSTEKRKKEQDDKNSSADEKLITACGGVSGIDRGFSFTLIDSEELAPVDKVNPETFYSIESASRAALSKMTDLQKNVLKLQESGFTQKEIASNTGLSIDQVRTQLKRIGVVAEEIKGEFL